MNSFRLVFKYLKVPRYLRYIPYLNTLPSTASRLPEFPPAESQSGPEQSTCLIDICPQLLEYT